jgi:hypothetical protein
MSTGAALAMLGDSVGIRSRTANDEQRSTVGLA